MNSVSFLKAVLQMMVGKVTLRFFSNEEDFNGKLKSLRYSVSEGVFQVEFDGENRDKLLNWDAEDDFLDFVERLEIVADGKLLFEGYDGMEFGTLSKTVDFTEKFREDYLENDGCIISKDW